MNHDFCGSENSTLLHDLTCQTPANIYVIGANREIRLFKVFMASLDSPACYIELLNDKRIVETLASPVLGEIDPLIPSELHDRLVCVAFHCCA